MSDDRDLTKTEEWFRTKLHEYLSYGVAGFSMLASWLHSNDSVISLHHQADAEKREAGIALTIILPALWIAWYLILLHIRRQCPDHPTVIQTRTIHLCAIAAGIGLLVIWCLVVDIFSPPGL